MRKLVLFLSLIGVCLGCNQTKNTKDYKVVRDEVMQFHDQVMEDQGVIVKNHMKLDTLLRELKDLKSKFPEIDTLQEAIAIKSLITKLTKADDDMNDWMHQFEPDITGKSNVQAIAYFEAEKRKVAAIDSVYKQEIKMSGAYINKFKY
jgi:GTPase involved in cell partitioning and DNA repair